ncbi:MAG: hypothetical protein J6L72_03745 [Butyricicoccus sp.]|nr:hypothetical protein [Butyricicoccus sp.]
MICPERLVGVAAAAFGVGVLIGGLLPCLIVKWLCGLGLITVGVIIIRW